MEKKFECKKYWHDSIFFLVWHWKVTIKMFQKYPFQPFSLTLFFGWKMMNLDEKCHSILLCQNEDNIKFILKFSHRRPTPERLSWLPTKPLVMTKIDGSRTGDVHTYDKLYHAFIQAKNLCFCCSSNYKVLGNSHPYLGNMTKSAMHCWIATPNYAGKK